MKTSSVEGSARLVGDLLWIKRRLESGKTLETVYRVMKLDPHPDVGSPAIRLCGLEEVYDVILTEHGIVCDCADFANRRDGKDPLGCKHIRAVRVTRLI